jgi:hypothetical protein
VASKCGNGLKKERKMVDVNSNFTDLNKCCPKDDFPLERIDKIVDSTAR